MIKFIKYAFLFCFVSLSIVSCSDPEDRMDMTPEIVIGKDSQISELAINSDATRNIILSGGNGKFDATVENSKIASASISKDTLKIKGLLEGKTYVTIKSHNRSVKLNVNVVAPGVSISQDNITLYPGQESKFVTLTGGGEIVDLSYDNKDIMDVKWNGNTNVVEIFAHYEGDAKITIKAKGQADKTINVKIKCEGEANTPGLYSTDSRYIYPLLNHKMVTFRKNVGTWISATYNPYGSNTTKKSAIKINAITNPKVGETIDVNIYTYAFKTDKINSGTNKMYVEEIKNNLIFLRGKGFKLILPYHL